MRADQHRRARCLTRLVSRVITGTFSACVRYRVLGLAAEASFFTLLSLPPLVFALAGSIGFVADLIDPGVIEDFRDQTLQLASQALTPSAVDSLIRPTLESVLAEGRADVLLVGFLIAVWSGSRALSVLIETISIMYGHGGHRSMLLTLALSVVLYVVFLLLAMVLIPLVLAGPEVVARLLPEPLDWLNRLYWPITVCGSALFLAVLYSIAIPRGYRLRSAIPGAAFALLVWVAGSWSLRYVLGQSTASMSIYGPLTAPIALLLWIYVISIAILIGAALNAALAEVQHPERNDSPSAPSAG